MDGKRDEDVIKRVAMMIRGIKVAMLTTVAPDGGLHSRPMATQEVEFDGSLWFFTKASSPKAHEIRDDAEVNLAYSSPEDHRYVSVSGRATIVRDPAKARELWNPSYRVWFAKGVEDPDLVLLRVEARIVQYWDMLTGGMMVLPGFAREEMAAEA
jgi:general stress protein 26